MRDRLLLALALAIPAVAPAQSTVDAEPAGQFTLPYLAGRLRPPNIHDALDGVVSPDGRRYVYAQVEHGQSRLWLLDLATSTSRLLTPRPGSRWDVAWSYDGRRIAYAGHVGDSGHTPSGIWVLDVDAPSEQLVFAESRFNVSMSPSWTREGRIVFAQFAGDPERPTKLLRVVDPESGSATALTSRGMVLESPRVSPDGRQIAHIGPCGDSADWGLHVTTMGVPDSSARCLVRSAARSSIVWAPDSRAIYTLMEGADGYAHPVAVDVATGRQTHLPDTGVRGRIAHVSVTEDGRLLLAASSTTLRIGTVPAVGGVVTPLQRDSAVYAAFPVWSHDGAYVAAVSSTPRDWGEEEKRRAVLISARSDDPLRGQLQPRDFAGDTTARLTIAPDGGCGVNEGSYLSRDSLVALQQVAPRGAWFTQDPLSYAHAGYPNALNLYQPGTLWSSDSRFVIKQAWRHLYRIARDSASTESSSAACRAFGAPRRIALDGFSGMPVGWQLSPDARAIAFSRIPVRGRDAGLFVVDARGGAVRNLRWLPRDESFGAPQWSLDGRALYFADADSTHLYRILKLTIATGVLDTITRGPVSAVHPRLSPDGRTLAVTLADAASTLWWMNPLGGVARQAPPLEAPRHAAERTIGSPPHPLLVDLAERIAARRTSLERVWPGYWPDTQAYALVGPPGQGMLLVARHLLVAGFHPVRTTGGRSNPMPVFWRAGQIEDPYALRVPIALIDSFPRSDADSATLVRWRERVLFDLFYGTMGSFGQIDAGARWRLPAYRHGSERVVFANCPMGVPSSCYAMRQLERLALTAALSSARRDVAAAARRYVAVRWMRRVTGGDEDRQLERLVSTRRYAASHAASVVAGSDASGHARDVAASLSTLSESDTATWQRKQRYSDMTGQAVLLLLDRLGAEWKTSIMRGDDAFQVLARAVHFDSLRALSIAKQAHVRFELPILLARATRPSDTSAAARRERSDVNRDQHYYYRLIMQALASDSAPLGVLVPNLPRPRWWVLDTSKVRIRFSAGSGDSASNAEGMLALPDPDLFVVETAQFRLEVRHVPVLIDPAPSSFGIGMGSLVSLYLPDRVSRQLRLQEPQQSRRPGMPRVRGPGQRLRARNYDLWIKPEAVERINFVTSATFVMWQR